MGDKLEWVRFRRYYPASAGLLPAARREYQAVDIAHTYDCRAAALRWRLAHDRYLRRWPDYCRQCGATGEIHYTENAAPHGEGFWGMESIDPCGCVENCRCPRCGTDIWDIDGAGAFEQFYEAQEACPHCGFSWGWKAGDHAPCRPECFCYYEMAFED